MSQVKNVASKPMETMVYSHGSGTKPDARPPQTSLSMAKMHERLGGLQTLESATQRSGGQIS